jgi:hypothetical protein
MLYLGPYSTLPLESFLKDEKPYPPGLWFLMMDPGYAFFMNSKKSF